MQNRLRHSGLALGSAVIASGAGSWRQRWYILRSGSIWYKREINNLDGYFALWYSSNAGATWDLLMTLDITEPSVVIDLIHIYIHSIVGTSYHVSTTGGELLYNT